jgi:L-threonylcarbamoyladenylate synthase
LKRRQRNSNNTVNLVRINPLSPDPDDIRQAAEILGKKGVLVFPTSGLYGLGADARCAEAIRRVFAIKRRPLHQPLLVLLSGIQDLDTVVKMVPGCAEPLLKLWPGGITLIFRAGDHVPAGLTGGTGKIGVRLPAHPVAKALLAQFGSPITATSANLSGCRAAARVTRTQNPPTARSSRFDSELRHHKEIRGLVIIGDLLFLWENRLLCPKLCP